MQSKVETILRSATRKESEPLNILTSPTHERYETGLVKTGHNFFAYRAEGIKDWNTKYGKIPDNYVLLNPRRGENQVPHHVKFDLILSQNKFGQFQALAPLAGKMGLPLVSLEHTLPMEQWSKAQLKSLGDMRGDCNVFISKYSIGKWEWEDRGDTEVITHMVDVDLFKPTQTFFSTAPQALDKELPFEREPYRNPHILSVVNDWINRDYFCNFQGWQRITQGLNTMVLGDTPGLSEPAKSIDHLVRSYQESLVFLNTSTVSPVPTALLEALSCGCAVVSTATCMIPEVIEHGVNGFMSNNETELREYCELLLQDVELADKLGRNARKTIEEKFHPDQFVSKWKSVFERVL